MTNIKGGTNRIVHVCVECGKISVAAKRLGISRNTIYRKLRWRSDGR